MLAFNGRGKQMEGQGSLIRVPRLLRNDSYARSTSSWSTAHHSPLEKIMKRTENAKSFIRKSLKRHASALVSSSGKEERRGSGFLAGWPHWQEYSRNRQERCSSIEAMASDDAEDSELVCEAEESPVGKESVSLAVGEGFITEIPLSFSILQRSTQGPNVRLQEAARKMLWALENDNKDISMLFKELSARLVSIQASQDLFLITFKTVEEIWKFTTYLSLGFVACSLEHLLFDERYWLNSALVEDTEIHVSINQDQLARLYLGLLLQEGNFYAKSVVSSGGGIEFDEGNSEFLEVRLNDVVHIKDVGDESAWEGQSLSTGERGLVPIVAVEPLSHPFYQWFLKTYPVSCNIMDPDCLLGTSQPIGEGFCIATDNHVATGWDELSYITGDTIEVVGFFIPGLKWFVGRCPSNGVMGFVRTNNVDTSCLKALDKDLLFLSEEERSFLNVLDDDTQKGCMDLLSSLCQTDISSVYRLDGMEPMGIYMKASPVINEDLGEIQITESWEECEAVSGSSKGSASEKSSPDSEWKGEVEGFHIQAQDDIDDPKFFVDLNTGEVDDSEVFEPVLTFLNKEGYQVYFQPLYDLPMSFLSTTFYGFSEEEDLVFYLETSRNWAKKSQMTWSHIRCCFLLGRICAKRMKLSQARVYFEEALSATRQGFLDLHLLRALYGNLAAIYLKQNMKPKQDLLVEKAASLLACLPHHNFSSEIEFEVLKYILRKSIIVNNVSSEARTCFLIFRLLQQLGRYDEALPFVERLQFLLIASCSQTLNPTLGVMPILSYFYDKKYLPRVALASSKLCKTVGIKIMQSAMWRAGIVIQNIYKITEGSLKNNYIPAQAAPYLKHALSCSYESGDVKAQRTLCLILSKLYLQYKLFSGAICYSKRAAELGRWTSDEEAFESSVFLGWMYVLDGHYEQACKILMLLLESMQETDSTTQCGVVHNLLANAKKMDNNVIEASRGYTQALKMATETGNRRNQAIVMANFGRLSLSCQAVVMAESYFLHSVQLYIEVQGSDEAERELVQVLHWLGQIFTQQRILEKGILCYELALMFALKSNNLKSQLSIIEELCNFYSKVCPVTATHIIYCEHWMYLVQLLKDKRKEGELLSTLSQLYQTLNTAKSLRKALDYTKQSLRISIDLGQRDQAAENWLQAGRLYYMMGEQELVEIYLYAAIQASQKAQDIAATLRLYEAAGDVFFHGVQRRERAMYFYKEGALPLAKKVQDTEAQLRLFHKLTQLLVSQGHYKKSVEYATMAVRLSASVESPLDELVAFHRLAGVYYSQRIYEIAEYCYLKALSLCPSPMQHDAETGYYLKIYWRLGNIALLKRKDAEDAATYFLLALAAAIGIENEDFQLVLSNKLMDIYGKFLLNEEQADNFRKLLVQLSMKST